jgi:hypothetical protein
VSIEDQDDMPTWARHRPQPQPCPIGAEGCEKTFTVSRHRAHAKTCPNPECKAEYKRRYAKEYYDRDPDKNIAQSTASRRRRHKPIVKHCIAPHPTIEGSVCGKEFVAKGREVTCSDECSVRRRWALQRDRYNADPQAKRDYKNAHYAANLAKPVGKTRCPNPACGREYLKKKISQHTCGRAVCHLWHYSQTHQDQINERKRKKRRENPDHAAYVRAYQRNYQKANPDKFEAYRPKKIEAQRRRRAVARQAAIAAGTYVDRRYKLTDAQRSKITKRRKAGETLAKIAKSYGVSITAISRIADKKQKA